MPKEGSRTLVETPFLCCGRNSTCEFELVCPGCTATAQVVVVSGLHAGAKNLARSTYSHLHRFSDYEFRLLMKNPGFLVAWEG